MLITYCLTVRLLARQQQSLCGGGSGSGATTNGWASGWLGQQPQLGNDCMLLFTNLVDEKQSKEKHNFLTNIFFFVPFFFFRTTMYMATIAKDKSAINTEPCSFSHLHRYRIINTWYTWIVAARFKVSTWKKKKNISNCVARCTRMAFFFSIATNEWPTTTHSIFDKFISFYHIRSIPEPTPSTMTALHQFGAEMLKLSRGLDAVSSSIVVPMSISSSIDTSNNNSTNNMNTELAMQQRPFLPSADMPKLTRERNKWVKHFIKSIRLFLV